MRTTRVKKNTIRRKVGSTGRKQIRKLARLSFVTGLIVACALTVCHASCTTKSDYVTGVQHLQTEPALETAFELPEELGTYRITFYCSCQECCGEWANKRPIDPSTGEAMVYGSEGVLLKPGYSCATSREFAAGTVLYVNGYGSVRVDDRPADWVLEKYDNRVIDIYLNDHDEIRHWQSSLGDYAEVLLYD